MEVVESVKRTADLVEDSVVRFTDSPSVRELDPSSKLLG
jgi:hypothetical protein